MPWRQFPRQVSIVHESKVFCSISVLLLPVLLQNFNPLNAELNPICHLLALLRLHHFLHVSRIRVKSLTLRLLMSYIYIYIYMEHLFLMFLDHTQRRSTVGKTPLDEWSARRTDLYLTTHDTHNRQISMPPLGFEPTIAAGERPLADKISIFHTVPGMSGAMEHVSVRNLSHALSKNC